MVLGQRLQAARARVQMSMAQVEEATGIGQSSLSEFENDKREPRLHQLTQLASVYRRSLTYFFEEEEPADQVVLWRQKPDQAGLIERDFLKLCEQYSLLEGWTNDFIDPRLPRVDRPRYGLDYAWAEDLARRTANELNLGDRPALMLLPALVEDCGLKIFHLEFEPTGTAACAKSKEHGWAVLLNAKNSRARRNFDLAHELFHLLVWDIYQADGGREATPEEERLADAFASALLMPTETLKRAVTHKRHGDGKVSVRDLCQVAQQFGVSIHALMWRIHRVYGLDQKKTSAVIDRAAGNPTYRVETEAVEGRPRVLPDRYLMLAIRALREGELSVGKFMEYTSSSRREAIKYLEAEDSAADEVSIATD